MKEKSIWYVVLKGAHLSFDKFVWPWIDLSVGSLIPFFLLITGNATIIVRIARARSAAKTKMNVQQDHIQMKTMTFLLLGASFIFMITTAPMCIYMVLDNAEKVYYGIKFYLFWNISNMLMYINNAINFWLYCVSGPRFRKELLDMFGIKSKTDHKRTMPECHRHVSTRANLETSIELNTHI